MIRVMLGRSPLDRSYVAGFSFAALAFVATTACGKEKEVVQEDSSTVPTSVSTSVDSGTVVPTVPVNVSFEEAESVYKERRYAEATAMFDSYVQRKPDNAFGHYMLGLSAWKAGELDRARSAFEKSLELDAKHVKTLLNLSRVLIEQGKPKDALTHVTTAVQLDSMSGDVRRMMGRVQTELRQPNEAVESYRVALSLQPTDIWSMNNMALVLIQQGRFDEALPPLARAVQLDSSVAVFPQQPWHRARAHGSLHDGRAVVPCGAIGRQHLQEGVVEPSASGAARRRSVGEPDQPRRVGRDVRS